MFARLARRSRRATADGSGGEPAADAVEPPPLDEPFPGADARDGEDEAALALQRQPQRRRLSWPFSRRAKSGEAPPPAPAPSAPALPPPRVPFTNAQLMRLAGDPGALSAGGGADAEGLPASAVARVRPVDVEAGRLLLAVQIVQPVLPVEAAARNPQLLPFLLDFFIECGAAAELLFWLEVEQYKALSGRPDDMVAQVRFTARRISRRSPMADSS